MIINFHKLVFTFPHYKFSYLAMVNMVSKIVFYVLRRGSGGQILVKMALRNI